MKKLLHRGIAIAAGAAAAFCMSVCAFAAEYEIDVSEAKQSTGSYGQSLKYYTCLGDPDNAANNFDPRLMTPDSEVYIEYELEGEYATGDNGYISVSPVQLIWQSWKGGVGNSESDIWAQVAPYEYDENSAAFTYDDIVTAYGTDDFSTVYCILAGDTGVKLTVTSMRITNVSAGDDAAAETEVTESSAVEVTLTTAAIVENAPVETNAAPIVAGVVIGIVAVVVVAVVVILMIRANKRKNY